jgi:SAM-dependent methyltransferase
MMASAGNTIRDGLVPSLRCPFCRAPFSFREFDAPRYAAAEFGILECGCSRFPVLDGIPVVQRSPVGMFEHTTGGSQVGGAAPDELVRLIETGRGMEALERCLTFATRHPRLERILGWRLSHSRPVDELARRQCIRRLRAQVLRCRDRTAARDVLGFFYRPESPLGTEVGRYFYMRFGQPRHIAALALLESIEVGDGPVLDLACGLGHIGHYLTRRARPARVIGLDINFFHLWIARHWIAPATHVVCASVANGLPFCDDAFAGVFCSDAYHLIPDRQELVKEFRRCAPARPIVLARVGNRAVMPNEGAELDCPGYVAELGGDPVQVFGEEELVRDYLARRSPFAGPGLTPQESGRTKWLSFVVNGRDVGVAGDVDPAEWPHAVGRLQWNPLYSRIRGNADSLDLRFQFPSTWYAYENGTMLRYHPRKVQVRLADLESLRSGAADSLRESLVGQFVLLGMPERYAGTDDPGVPSFDDATAG